MTGARKGKSWPGYLLATLEAPEALAVTPQMLNCHQTLADRLQDYKVIRLVKNKVITFIV